ncbi:MAG: hypothetical protein JWM00_657 [Candidatus Saccharibacteria bacterium]|nr:hypothetical protein [Candidatus Saccharibacteria bacterium]
MPVPNNEYHIPRIEAAEFGHNDRIDLHLASESALPYDQIKLAREAVTLATSGSMEQPIPAQPEAEIPTFAQLRQVGINLRAFSKYEVDSRINLFSNDEAA